MIIKNNKEQASNKSTGKEKDKKQTTFRFDFGIFKFQIANHNSIITVILSFMSLATILIILLLLLVLGS